MTLSCLGMKLNWEVVETLRRMVFLTTKSDSKGISRKMSWAMALQKGGGLPKEKMGLVSIVNSSSILSGENIPPLYSPRAAVAAAAYT